MPDPKKPYVIVVGIDYSETGELAFDKALELSLERPRAEVHVLHVMPLNLPLLAPELEITRKPATAAIGEAAARLTEHVEKKLATFRKGRESDAALAELRVVPHLRTDSPATEVAQLAADLEADLVVVGTHGRRALARLFVGSVAEVTVRLAPCPVLVVRPKMRPAPIPAIEPPCPRCLEERAKSAGRELWCEQHREQHGQRHTYHQSDRAGAETNMPLVGRW
jgi:nucleotide-binding universal stress UspA family protein